MRGNRLVDWLSLSLRFGGELGNLGNFAERVFEENNPSIRTLLSPKDNTELAHIKCMPSHFDDT